VLLLPLLAHADWQVEIVIADLGTALRESIEVRHSDHRLYCTTALQRDVVLREHSLDLRDFTETDVDDDGCE
jgi:hypothetical protein